MEAQPQQTRQTWGCAYEPPADESLRRYLNVPTPIGCSSKLTTCPGYTTQLPEVIEIARARLHWSKGELTSFCHGQARSALLFGIEILEGASNECQQWAIENPHKKAGQ